MLSKKYSRIAGAAMAGTAAMLFTSAAGAIDLDVEDSGVTYAAETLISTGKIDVEDVDYYLLGGQGDERNIVVEPGVALAQHTDRMLVTFTLEGLVFSGDLTDSDLTVENTTTSPTGFQAQLISQGDEGDSVVLYSLTGQTFTDADEITLVTRGFAISGTTGSITMKAKNVNLAEIFPDPSESAIHTHEKTLYDAISLKKALAVVTDPEDPMDPRGDRIATVRSEYEMFESTTASALDVLYAQLGNVMVDTVDGLRLANADANDVDDLSDILSDPADAEENSIAFMGDFSFASKVHVDASADCDGDAPLNENLLQMDDDDNVMDTTSAVMLSAFATMEGLNLCITVDPESKGYAGIPDTGHYMAVYTLEGIGEAVHEPERMPDALRRIRRDGTTVHIPFLTTYMGYNQRIVLSNRGTRDANFRIMFRPEDAVTATPKMGDPDVAECDTDVYYCDMLEGGQTLTLRATNVVELVDGARTAATVMVEARDTNIDVSSVIVNTVSQDTDTVVHHSAHHARVRAMSM